MRYIILPLLLIFFIVSEIYTFIAVKEAAKSRWFHWAYLAVTLLIIAYIVYSFTQFDRRQGQTRQTLFRGTRNCSKTFYLTSTYGPSR